MSILLSYFLAFVMFVGISALIWGAFWLIDNTKWAFWFFGAIALILMLTPTAFLIHDMLSGDFDVEAETLP